MCICGFSLYIIVRYCRQCNERNKKRKVVIVSSGEKGMLYIKDESVGECIYIGGMKRASLTVIHVEIAKCNEQYVRNLVWNC